jgi:PAS domain-containing protein
LSIVKSTGQYQEIYNKWFGALEPPGLSRETVIKHVGAILAVFLLIAVGLILWTVSLRKQVSLRTKYLTNEIQERKKMEEALRESEIRYRELFENMGSGVSVYGTHNNGEDFVFKEYNPAAEKLDKTPREQAIGRSVVDVFPEVKAFGLF